MTNYNILYIQVQNNLRLLPKGSIFRLTDLCDNPPAGLGRIFRKDVVVKQLYPTVRWVRADKQSDIYKKL